MKKVRKIFLIKKHSKASYSKIAKSQDILILSSKLPSTRKFKHSLTVYFVIATAIVPYFALDGTIRYRLPLPCGFLIGSGFILPDTYSVSKVMGEETNFPITAELTVSQIWIVVLTAFFAILLLAVLQYRFYIKQSEGGKGI